MFLIEVGMVRLFLQQFHFFKKLKIRRDDYFGKPISSRYLFVLNLSLNALVLGTRGNLELPLHHMVYHQGHSLVVY
jgi:hypothetical protein